MATPPREHDDEDERARFDFHPDQSDEVEDTLKSAHQAEVELGYHYHGKKGEELEAGPVPDELNGTQHFHNQKAYFERGFAGKQGHNPNKINNLGGYLDGDDYVSGGAAGKDRRWWKHLERDKFDGMKYVKNDSSNGALEQPDFKSGFTIEIDGLDDSWTTPEGGHDLPAKKATKKLIQKKKAEKAAEEGEDEAEEEPKKKAVKKEEEPKAEEEEEEEVVEVKKPKKEKKKRGGPPKMPDMSEKPGYTSAGDPADKGEAAFMPPELDPNFGQGMVQKSAPAAAEV